MCCVRSHYLAHHLESCMEQFFGSLVIDSLWSVVHHGIVTHQFKVRLRAKKDSSVRADTDLLTVYKILK